MSDASVDRYGDVVEAQGWDIQNFKRHPIALFNHDINQPIGLWENVRVEKGALRGRLKLAPQGSSQRLAEMHTLFDAGVLKATSVGFRKLEAEPIDNSAACASKNTSSSNARSSPCQPTRTRCRWRRASTFPTTRCDWCSACPPMNPIASPAEPTGVPAEPSPARKPRNHGTHRKEN